jgi:CBS domain-containing protein
MNGPLTNKTAKDFMTPRVVTASRGTNGQVLAQQLLSGLFSGLPIVEPDGEVVGVVTEFDLLKAFKEGADLKSLKAEELMTAPPLCIVEDTPLEIILQKMIDHQVIRLPVVRNRKVVGVISRANILSQMVTPDSHTRHILPLCYWCEKVRDDSDAEPGQGVWSDLQTYLEKHHLNSYEVSFMHVFCPQCTPIVNRLSGEK